MCVNSRPRDSETIYLREHRTRSSLSICWQKLRVARSSESSLLISVLQSCTLELMNKFT